MSNRFAVSLPSDQADLISKIQQKFQVINTTEEQVADAGLTLATLTAQLEQEKSGESVIREQVTKAEEEIKFKAAQVVFYDDGVRSLQRLYEMCLEDLNNKERTINDLRLEHLRKTTNTNTALGQKQAVLNEFESVKEELAQITFQLNAIDGEVQLALEKMRNSTNQYFGSIQNDFEALREWRKFKYYSEMYTKLRLELTGKGQKIRTYSAEHMYSAILRNKIPLPEWIEFTKTQLLRPDSEPDEGTPMAEDAEFEKVTQVLSYLGERARQVNQLTWPDVL
eukprot:c7861_g2_i2.p1 GENE.c7861_g2_i2~~c7861_g2_i2.p1  ORF type:complete len:289 (+),score=74.58 c7861_g2_i2:26-868(+)